ncbi:MAG TPA: ABATE domain-containing protein [Anaeromyxobacteraceae bacterium]|nr:ABATE domain-containing protein [Anaeromyxobacteraceae bacterium]
MGGRLSLDFTNTVSGKRILAPLERLNGYPDLVSWGRQVGALDAAQARRLLAEAERDPAAAARAFGEAIAFREALFRLFRAVAEGGAAAPEDLDHLSRVLARARTRERLVRRDGRFALEWPEDDASLDRVLWPVARSAAEVLTSRDVSRVRLCEATATEGCGWLFLDETRNRSRRWCSMKDCGNRAKARRHYRRRRAEG